MRLPIAGAALLLSCAGLFPHGAMAEGKDPELVRSCRGVLKAAAPARRVWLQRDLFAYELHAALGAPTRELGIYKENLIDTCTRVAYNNQRQGEHLQ